MVKRISGYFDLLLDLDENWQVVDLQTNYQTKEIQIRVEFIGKKGMSPIDFDLCSIHDYTKLRRWRHLDIMDYHTYIECRIPRIRDKQGKVKIMSVSWASKYGRYTAKFESKVVDLLLVTKNQTKTASFMQCGFRVVNAIIHKSIERGLSRRNLYQIHIKISLINRLFYHSFSSKNRSIT